MNWIIGIFWNHIVTELDLTMACDVNMKKDDILKLIDDPTIDRLRKVETTSRSFPKQ